MFVSIFNVYSQLLVVCLAVPLINGTPCSLYTKCSQCVTSESWIGICRWCPLDRQCHAYGSPKNPCSSDMDVKVKSECGNKRGSSVTYDRELSYVYAMTSAAAYSDDPQKCLDKTIPKSDFTVVEVNVKPCTRLSFVKDMCFAFVAVSHQLRQIVVSYRGTNSVTQLIKQALLVLDKPKVSFPAGGKVQQYFKDAFDNLYPCVEQSVGELLDQNPDYQVVITGHSLGGALASLAAMTLVFNGNVLGTRMALYTYGQPRVGNKDYAFHHDVLVKNSWRVVHAKDIVAHLPTCSLIAGCKSAHSPYHHKAEVFYPNENMTLASKYKVCMADEDRHCSNEYIKKCWYDIFQKACIYDHTHYYNVRIGELCSGKYENNQTVWNKYLKSSETCTRIKVP